MTLPAREQPITRAEARVLKAKLRRVKDYLSREYYAALLEGLQYSPWYHDDNAPSLYRDRKWPLLPCSSWRFAGNTN